MRNRIRHLGVLTAIAIVLASCSAAPAGEHSASSPNQNAQGSPGQNEQRINQPPVEPIIERNGNVVNIVMTAQVTDVEISKGVTYNAWTFNGTVPGPVIRVREGDVLHFTLKNLDPSLPHSHGSSCRPCRSGQKIRRRHAP
jgi:nitrite reductase (NO-forming)